MSEMTTIRVKFPASAAAFIVGEAERRGETKSRVVREAVAHALVTGFAEIPQAVRDLRDAGWRVSASKTQEYASK